MSRLNLFRPLGIPKAVLSNGVGRYIPQCQRITLKFCKSNGVSRPMREFIENDVIHFAKCNQSVVIYLKPRRHRGPVIVAEYLNGGRQWLDARPFSREDIGKWLNLLVTQSGQREETLLQLWHTNYPSVQGPWTPFSNRNPDLNVTEFPQENLSLPQNLETTATEKLLEIYKKQHLDEKDSL